ncbi:MAG: GIY-YIG nuclease family protein [Oscillospiraceae bacterium]|nr:GIY-YIG nuclease family protein [Oscillospiraceae bacterium]
MENIWYLYILRCKDGSLYTGITTDIGKRLEAHRAGKGAKYTRGRGPLELVYREECGTHSEALKRELQVKALSREEKMQLVDSFRKLSDLEKTCPTAP